MSTNGDGGCCQCPMCTVKHLNSMRWEVFIRILAMVVNRNLFMNLLSVGLGLTVCLKRLTICV